jgi:hypothetical protein
MNGGDFMVLKQQCPLHVKIEKIMKALVDMFSLFMLQVAKKDGNIYPPTR